MPHVFLTNFLKPLKVSPSGRPSLFENEHDIMMKNEIGIYQDNYKLKYYQCGRLYLTNQRIIFINDRYNNLNLFLNIDDISTIQYTGKFLKSNPKIILKLKDNINHSYNSDILQKKSNLRWICPICYFSNDIELSEKEVADLKEGKKDLPFCITCGVQSTVEIIRNSLSSNFDCNQNNSIDLLSFDKSQCSVCTFINHPSMVKCEICGADLQNEKNLPIEKSYNIQLKLETDQNFDVLDLTNVKFSFRNGASRTFFECLKNVMSRDSEDTKMGINKDSSIVFKPSNGIHGLTNQTTQRNYEDSILLNNSIQDLDQLMKKANDLIMLSKKYQNILLKSNHHSIKDDEAVTQNLELLKNSKTSINKMNSIIKKNQIDQSINKRKAISALNRLKEGLSSNTKSKLPTLYLDELARNIGDFIISENILDKNNGIITTLELYYLYNKEREINLISAEELSDAISRFKSLNLNLEVTKISFSKLADKEAVFAISKKNQKISVSSKVLKVILSNPGISILQLQKIHVNVNYFIIKTILDKLLVSGDIVVDTTLKGNFYWPNNIMNNNNSDSKNSGKKMEKSISLGSSGISSIFTTGNSRSLIASHTFNDLKDIQF